MLINKLKAMMSPTQQQGAAAEQLALTHMQRAGLSLLCRNYHAAGGAAGKQLGEIDLIMRTPEGMLVFAEVRERKSASFGGAAASVTISKQKRLIKAAQHYLAGMSQVPACRFDVLAIDRDASSGQPRIEWIQDAFEAN